MIRVLIVCGSRGVRLTLEQKNAYLRLLIDEDVQEVWTGKGTGIDEEAERIAQDLGLKTRGFPADWRRYDLGPEKKNPAGPIRNRQMATEADPATDACLAFPGGSGTSDMVRCAANRGLRVLDWRTGNAPLLEGLRRLLGEIG